LKNGHQNAAAKTKRLREIGATDEKSEGNFKWVTGEKFEFATWRHEPDNLNGEQHYLVFNEGSGWDDTANDYEYRFMCEWECPNEFSPKP